MHELIVESIIGIKMHPGVNGLDLQSKNLSFTCKIIFGINRLIEGIYELIGGIYELRSFRFSAVEYAKRQI